MKTSYYVSFLTPSGSFLVSVWCDLSALLRLQKTAKEIGCKIVQRSVNSVRHFCNPIDAEGIYHSSVCAVG